MENEYLNQIQDLLNNNENNNKTEQIQSNNDNMEEALQKNNKTNFDDMPIKKSTNNIDDMPIKGGNFNELLEKEMSKEQNEGYNNQELNKNVEPRFKYIPKKRTEIISAPSNTKKYKYYSDNFKSKKNKKEKNEEKNDNYNFKSNINNSKNQKKESNNFKKKEKIENFSKYEKENDIKEPPLSFNQNTNTGKIVDKRLDFSNSDKSKIIILIPKRKIYQRHHIINRINQLK